MQKDSSNWNIVIAAFVIACILFVCVFNALFWLRKKFPIKVNCWFCNTNQWVPYHQFNSFVCKLCQQYNGFTEQGDYNQRIQVQYSSHLNKDSYCKREASELVKPSKNVFCEYCSRNQELKIIQLANFRPRYEENFDAECEEYKQKLEDAYQLCPPCQRILNRTLNRVKSKFIGSKIAQLKKQINQHVLIINSGPKLMPTLLAVVALVLSLMSLRYDLNFEFFNDLTIWNKFNEFYATIHEMLATRLTDFNFSEVNIDKLSLCAIIFNFFLIDQRSTRSHTLFSMLLWSLRMASNEFLSDEFYEVKVFISSLLIINSVVVIVRSRKNEEPNTSFVNITNEEESEEESEVEIDCKSIRSNNTSYQHRESLASFHHSSPKIIDDTYTIKNFSITKEVNAADRKMVHHDLNKLTLTDPNKSTFATSSTSFNSTVNPFAVENYRSESPAPSLSNSIFTSVSQRNFISPPRLHAPQIYAATKDDTLCSWVAGGYWVPPQKRFLETPKSSGSSSNSTSGVGTNDTHPSLDKSFNTTFQKLSSASTQVSLPKIFSDQHHSTIISPLPMRHNHSIFHSQFNNSFKKYRDSSSTYKKIV